MHDIFMQQCGAKNGGDEVMDLHLLNENKDENVYDDYYNWTRITIWTIVFTGIGCNKYAIWCCDKNDECYIISILSVTALSRLK